MDRQHRMIETSTNALSNGEIQDDASTQGSFVNSLFLSSYETNIHIVFIKATGFRCSYL